MINARFTREFIDVWNCIGYCRSVLYNKDVLKILLRHLLTAGDGEKLFYFWTWKQHGKLNCISLCKLQFYWRHSRGGFKRYWALRRLKPIGMTKISMQGSVIGLLQIYLDSTASTMRCRAYVMYPMHVVFLFFSQEIRKKLNYNGNRHAGHLPVPHGKGGVVCENLRRYNLLRWERLGLEIEGGCCGLFNQTQDNSRKMRWEGESSAQWDVINFGRVL